MPRAKKAKKQNRKKKSEKLTLIMRSPNPPRTKVRLKYVDLITLDPATSTFTDYVFRANSPHDPDYTGIGHQPLYWDQLSSRYEKYVVTGAKLKMSFIPTTSSTGVAPGYFGCFMSENTAFSYADELHAIEDGQTFKIAGPVTGSGRNTAVERASFSLTKQAVTPGGKNDDTNQGIVGGNPATGYYFHCWAASPDQTNSFAMQFIIELTQDIELFNRDIVAQS